MVFQDSSPALTLRKLVVVPLYTSGEIKTVEALEALGWPDNHNKRSDLSQAKRYELKRPKQVREARLRRARKQWNKHRTDDPISEPDRSEVPVESEPLLSLFQSEMLDPNFQRWNRSVAHLQAQVMGNLDREIENFTKIEQIAQKMLDSYDKIKFSSTDLKRILEVLEKVSIIKRDACFLPYGRLDPNKMIQQEQQSKQGMIINLNQHSSDSIAPVPIQTGDENPTSSDLTIEVNPFPSDDEEE